MTTPRDSGSNRVTRPRIACVGDFPLGSRRAHAINVIKTSGGFARLGWEVLLLCREPERVGSLPPAGRDEVSRLLGAYGEPTLRVETLASPDERTHPPGSDKRCTPMAEWAAERAAAFGAAAMYSRLAHAAIAWADAGGQAIAETHAYIGEAKPGFQRLLEATARAVNPVAAISTISPRLREHYIERGAAPARVHVVPDGVDLRLFRPPEGAAPGPRSSQPGAPRAVYSGHLYDYKGIPVVLEAAALLPDVRFELIGGLPEDIARVRGAVRGRGLANVSLRGWIDHAALPPHLWSADVLLLPPGLADPSRDWTSPVKLGEYLAAGPPIVASAIPALRDWVDEPVVAWFAPDDARSMARAIHRVLGEPADQAARRRSMAMELARAWCYPERACVMLHAAGIPARAGARPMVTRPHP